MPARVILKVTTGPIAGNEFVFDSHDTFLFGRHGTCHARLPNDGFVSRHHFILEANPPTVCIRDLGSLNGTHVNEVLYKGRDQNETPEQGARRKYENIALVDGDTVRVGNTSIDVRVESPPTCSRCGADALSEGQLCADCETEQEQEQQRRTTPEMLRCSVCGVAVEPPEGTWIEEYQCEDCSFANELAAPVPPPPPPAPPAPPTAGKPPALDPTVACGETAPKFRLDGYRIERELGRGGMGAVYLGYPKEGPPEPVAIKRLLAQVAVNERIRRQFLREMEINVDLKHRNIVRFMRGVSTGRQFSFIMEYCDGGSLEDFVQARGGRLEATQAVRLLLPCLDGLAYAHRKGFVHRDIKPQNLLLSSNAHGAPDVKISDFGLAKSFQLAGLSGMTATGNFGGSWHYMPREQMTNFKYVQPTSDVWSFAASLYRIITSRYPRNFPKDRDPVEVILNEKCIPLRDRLPDAPASVSAAIDRALASDPRERFANANELRVALENAI